MGNCATFYDELRFDTRDPEVTHVYMFIRAEGDCPFWCYGWHHKAFPSSVNTLEIHTKLWEGEDPVTWDRKAPGEMRETPIFNGHDHVPVTAQELFEWWKGVIDGGKLTPVEIADQITARLTSVPDWNKACPICRAHDMMLQAQRNPPQ